MNLGFILTKPEMIAERQTKIVLVSFTMSYQAPWVKEKKLELIRCIVVFVFIRVFLDIDSLILFIHYAKGWHTSPS